MVLHLPDKLGKVNPSLYFFCTVTGKGEDQNDTLETIWQIHSNPY